MKTVKIEKRVIVLRVLQKCTLGFFILLLGGGGVQASETARTSTEARPSSWTATVGGAIVTAPEFEGADRYDVQVAPIYQIEYQERFFLSSMKGVGVYLFNSPDWQAGAAVNYNPGRRAKDSPLLRGMGNIDAGITIGMFAAWMPAPFKVSLDAVQGTGDVRGLCVTGAVEHIVSLTDRISWSNAVSGTFTDGNYNERFFGVNKKQSRHSRRSYKKYEPGAGIKDVAFTSGVAYALTDHVTILVQAGYSRLLGPAEDSPLVKAGSKHQAVGAVGATYNF